MPTFSIILIPAPVAVIIPPGLGHSLVFGLGYDAVLVSLRADAFRVHVRRTGG